MHWICLQWLAGLTCCLTLLLSRESWCWNLESNLPVRLTRPQNEKKIHKPILNPIFSACILLAINCPSTRARTSASLLANLATRSPDLLKRYSPWRLWGVISGWVKYIPKNNWFHKPLFPKFLMILTYISKVPPGCTFK